MPKSDLDRFFDQVEALTVGFAPAFREFRSAAIAPNYPPHNIVRVSDTEMYLELAVAGFKKDEIVIEEKDGVLTIRSDVAGREDDPLYQYRGIARRSFSKSVRLAEYYETTSAKLEDGILTIGFVKIVPEQDGPKRIAIS